MKLMINGNEQELQDVSTILDAVHQLGYNKDAVAVALNGDFVARADYASTTVAEHDAVELVAPMAGG